MLETVIKERCQQSNKKLVKHETTKKLCNFPSNEKLRKSKNLQEAHEENLRKKISILARRARVFARPEQFYGTPCRPGETTALRAFFTTALYSKKMFLQPPFNSNNNNMKNIEGECQKVIEISEYLCYKILIKDLNFRCYSRYNSLKYYLIYHLCINII